MTITHNIRGEDHLPNTPKQVLIYQALGFTPPVFAHVPLVLGLDRARLSKRHGATSVLSYRDAGYLPQALNNYLVRLGWSHGDQEIFTHAELIAAFSLDALGSSAGVFNPEKLEWVNAQHLQAARRRRARPPRQAVRRQRAVGRCPATTRGSARWWRPCRSAPRRWSSCSISAAYYFSDDVTIEPAAANKHLRRRPSRGDARPARRPGGAAGLDARRRSRQAFESVLARYQLPLGKLAQPVRVALTGGTRQPGHLRGRRGHRPRARAGAPRPGPAADRAAQPRHSDATGDAPELQRRRAPAQPLPLFSIFAQVSRSATVRLNTGAPGRESTLSAQK